MPKRMKLSIVLLPAIAMLLASCQGLFSRPSSAATEQTLLRGDVARMFPAIMPSQMDTFTYGTACQIVLHNTNLWCGLPETAPKEFDRGLCAPGRDVCLDVLGPSEVQPIP